LIVNYKSIPTEPCLNASSIDPEYFNSLRKAFPNQLLYKLWLVITQDVNFLNLERKEIQGSFTKSHSDLKRLQQKKPLSATSLSTMS
jgi:ferrous iron transport protein B